MKSSAACPCGSGATYGNCCRPYHRGKAAPTPEALMRSRFSAYAVNNLAHIMKTTHPESPHYETNRKAWHASLSAYTRVTQFVALAVLEAETAPGGEVGWVTFRAGLVQNGRDASFTEKSRFEKQGNRWLYVSAEGHTGAGRVPRPPR